MSRTAFLAYSFFTSAMWQRCIVFKCRASPEHAQASRAQEFGYRLLIKALFFFSHQHILQNNSILLEWFQNSQYFHTKFMNKIQKVEVRRTAFFRDAIYLFLE